VTWPITQVARMSGVTARTLRHYDEIGLLRPAHVGANGYRWYGREELLRLQEILLLRELGMGLAEIGRTLAGPGDRAGALRRHHARLVAERDRLDRLAATVSRTIAEIEHGRGEQEEEMAQDPERLFEGFDAARYEAEARERWGDEVVDGSRRRMAGWTKEDAAAVRAESTELTRRVADLMAAGRPVDDPAVLDAVDAHYRWVCRFWTPDRESYPGLGRLYVDDPRFRDNYEQVRPGLAEYLRDAMAAYAVARLS
jgi:DNA-binding transcriptional MerR regulator